MTTALGYAAKHSFSRLKPLKFERPAPKPNEVQIDVLYCGVCHSDIHQVENDWGNTVYPCMPGHEIVGRVSEAGA
ncbi:alcohol dehydrogenase catalytic domain-containing protein, partial [Sphingomonas bacterium]|uniref:alcohol dehydrogenase catalytic domain-containing protein n=1 Tax=Sphingomonas bacterium TaxID=1895847 RepID=UPI00157604C8